MRKRVGYQESLPPNDWNPDCTDQGILESLLGVAGVNLPVEEADTTRAQPGNDAVALGVQERGCVSLLVQRWFYVGVNDRRDMVTDARIYCGNSAISKLFIDRVAEAILRVLVRRGCDAASDGGKEGSKFLLNGRGAVALRVFYWRGEKHVGGYKVGCKAGIFLA